MEGDEFLEGHVVDLACLRRYPEAALLERARSHTTRCARMGRCIWDAWFWQGSRQFGWDNGDAGRNAIFVNIDGPAGWQNAVVATTLSHMGKHAPVLVIDGDGVPEPASSYLDKIKPYSTAPQEQLLNHGWIIGGLETVDWETQAEIDLLLEAYLDEEQP
ncbi:MAG: hypothetical protein ACR2KP_15015 [Egibacteraceae bacterium]